MVVSGKELLLLALFIMKTGAAVDEPISSLDADAAHRHRYSRASQEVSHCGCCVPHDSRVNRICDRSLRLSGVNSVPRSGEAG